MNYVFDLDGTLIDSTKRHYVLLKNLISDFGFSTYGFSCLHYLNFKRNGGNNFSYLVNKLGLSEPVAKQISDKWIENIEDYSLIESYDTLYDDSISTLKKLKANNQIFFLTCRQNPENLLHELKFLRIFDFADHINICSTKNSTINKTRFLQQLTCCGNKTLIIGDTEVDYNAAINSNCDYYILNRGFRSKRFWNNQGVKSYRDLQHL